MTLNCHNIIIDCLLASLALLYVTVLDLKNVHAISSPIIYHKSRIKFNNVYNVVIILIDS